MTDHSLTRVKLSHNSLLLCPDCSSSIQAVGLNAAEIMRWADNHTCPESELTEALTVLRLLTDERPCAAADLSYGVCPHGWIYAGCPHVRAWEILKRHPEISPSLPTDGSIAWQNAQWAATSKLTHQDVLDRSMARVGKTSETPPESVSKLLRTVPLTDALNLPVDGGDNSAQAYPVEYFVSVLQPGHHLFDRYSIRVRPCAIDDDKWRAVRFGSYLNANGEWTLPKTGDDWGAEDIEAWNASTSHTKEVALRLARQAAPHITCYGRTAAELFSVEPS